MDIKTLESFRLSDAISFHDELNPKLWNGMHLRPEVRKQLKKIADDFMDELGISGLDVVDVTVSGSNAAYSYTPHSDLDLHIIVDMSDMPDDEVYKELFNAKKNIYNDSHEITIHGVPIEVYVQDSREPVVSLGEYSIKNNDWIKLPTKRRANLDQTATKSKYNKLLDKINTALKSNNLKKINKTIKKIRQYRQAGLDKGGEFGPENLAYKVLRSQGYINKLYQLRDKLHSEVLTIENMYQDPERMQEDSSNSMSTEEMIAYLRQHHDKNLHQDYLDYLNTFGKFILKNIPVNSIKTELAGLDKAKVEQYKKMDFNKAPPIVMGDGYILDGYHRATVAKALGIPSIKAYVGVKGQQKVAETVHPDITSNKYFLDPTENVKMGDFEFNARTFTGGLADPNARGLQIRAYDLKHPKGYNMIGNADFIVKTDKKGNTWLESDDTTVADAYHGKGIAAMMYAFAKSLGNDIKPSPYQSQKGRQMWGKWGKDAEHLVGEDLTQQYAAEKTPAINPYGGLKDSQYRGAISEAFDQPYPIQWEESDYGDIDALAKLDDGTYLSIMFNNSGMDSWNVEFHRNNSQEVTGEGDAPRIFATVLTAIKQFIQEYNPHIVYFSAVKDQDPKGSRAKLYDRLVQRYASQLGYAVKRITRDDEVGYNLVRTQKVKEASGYIPSEKEKNDPRFKTALTVDVKPDSIKKNAKAFYWKTSRAGIPPDARPDGKF